MVHVKTRAMERLTDIDAGKDMEYDHILISNNSCLYLDIWNDYVETNKRLYRLKEEESMVNAVLEDVPYEMLSFLTGRKECSCYC